MTVNELIAAVDVKEPNQYAAAEKIAWLSALDGKIINEVLKTHEGYEEEEPFSGYTTGEEDLLLGFPYGEDIYTYYLIAMIAVGNAETARYNQQIALYNSVYSQWWNSYHSSHVPLHDGKRFEF